MLKRTEIWTLRFSPRDYPRKFVLRVHHQVILHPAIPYGGDNQLIAFQRPEAKPRVVCRNRVLASRQVPTDCHELPVFAEDDPSILGVWIRDA